MGQPGLAKGLRADIGSFLSVVAIGLDSGLDNTPGVFDIIRNNMHILVNLALVLIRITLSSFFRVV